MAGAKGIFASDYTAVHAEGEDQGSMMGGVLEIEDV